MSNIHRIEQALQASREQLNVALANGEDTSSIRAAIADTAAELADARRAEAESRNAGQIAEANAVNAAATNLTTETQAVIEARSKVDGLAELAGEPLPALTQDPAIEQAAQAVARARAALDKALAAQRPLIAQAELVGGRLRAKQEALEALKARRLAGDDRKGDAEEAALLSADIADIKLLADDSRFKATAAEPDKERSVLEDALNNLVRVEQRAVFNAAHERVLQAEQLFLKAHQALVNAGVAVGERNPLSLFRASNDLRRITFGTTGGL